MWISVPGQHRTLFLTGMLGAILLGACSKESEHPRTLDSASSSAPAPTTDSAAARLDTSAVTRSSVASTDTPPPAEKPDTKTAAKPSTLPKPSIDPGRKTTKRISVPETDGTPSPDSTARSAPATADQSQLVKFDAATNTVTFELIAGPFNFNGYSSGGATLVLPPKANAVINFVNKDGTPHSAEIISGEGPLPNAAVEPAIPRAYTNKLLEGLPQEAKDVIRFTAPESGTYRIFCGVPGHGLSGMWIWFKVDPAAKQPSFGAKK